MTYPSEKYWSVGMIILNMWENKKCSTPPSRFKDFGGPVFFFDTTATHRGSGIPHIGDGAQTTLEGLGLGPRVSAAQRWFKGFRKVGASHTSGE